MEAIKRTHSIVIGRYLTNFVSIILSLDDLLNRFTSLFSQIRFLVFYSRMCGVKRGVTPNYAKPTLPNIICWKNTRKFDGKAIKVANFTLLFLKVVRVALRSRIIA